MSRSSNRPKLTVALITGLALAGLTASASAVAQNRDVGTPSPPAQDVVTPSPIAQDQIATPDPGKTRDESDNAYVPGQESLGQCPLTIPESIIEVARSYPNPFIRVMTPTEFFASEEAALYEFAPSFGCGDKRQSIYIFFDSTRNDPRQDDGNRFELGAEQTATVDDPPNPTFDGELGTPQLDLPPDLPNGGGGGGGTTATTVFGGAARDGGTGRARTGGGQATRQVASPPPACGEPSDTLQRTYENTMRTMEGMLISYEQAVGDFAPRVEDVVVVDKGAPVLPEHLAWRAPGVRTKAEDSLFGCFQAGIAQDLRWHTGKPYNALARVVRVGLLSFETAGGAGSRGEENVLRSFYGLNHLLKYRFSDVLRPDQFQRRGWIPLSRQQLDQLIIEYGSRGGHPRGLVSIGYDNSSIGHVVNVRWNDAGQVELWDASGGHPADLSHVNEYWFFPTN